MAMNPQKNPAGRRGSRTDGAKGAGAPLEEIGGHCQAAFALDRITLRCSFTSLLPTTHVGFFVLPLAMSETDGCLIPSSDAIQPCEWPAAWMSEMSFFQFMEES